MSKPSFVAFALTALSGLAGCPARPTRIIVLDAAATPAPTPGRPELAEIARLEEARDSDDSLRRWALGTDPGLRRRALLALGRIGEPGDAATARDRLVDDDAAVRATAAFALELIGDAAAAEPQLSEQKLVVRATAEQEPVARRRVLRALGRLGGAAAETALRGLLRGPGRDEDGVTRGEALRGLMMHGVRGRALAPETRAALQQALTDPDPGARRAAAQALFRARCREDDVPSLTFALRDVDPTVRAAAARALSTAGAAATAPLVAALGDPDWRVRVEVARALAPLDRRALLGIIEPAHVTAAGDRLAVALAAIDAIGTPPSGDAALRGQRAAALGRELGLLPTDALPGDERGQAALGPQTRRAALPADPVAARDAAALRCALDGLRARLGADDEILMTCAPDDIVPPWRKAALRAMALGEKWSVKESAAAVPRLVALAAHPDGRVRAAAADALAASRDPRALAALARTLEDSDPGVLNASCDAIAKIAHEPRPKPATTPGRLDAGASAVAIAGRVLALDSGREVEALITCIDALRALEDKRALPALRARLGDANAEVRSHARDAVTWLAGAAPPAAKSARLPSLPATPEPSSTAAPMTARILTRRGPIVIELLADETPHTVAAFVALARRGFYDGLTFHRVVPDFVVQGGDPRGDGFGGPGFTLRDEPTPRRFERGTVGIALAGKDTGGSQLFICQADAPHLEGKFTAFARVVAGMEVVDRLVVGEPMLGVTIDGAAPTPLAKP